MTDTNQTPESVDGGCDTPGVKRRDKGTGQPGKNRGASAPSGKGAAGAGGPGGFGTGT
ncbi:MAG: hypothetical protein JWR59_1083 [Brevundimonas sp.]|nr:hypothetical protein [Brevundimonas sp.]